MRVRGGGCWVGYQDCHHGHLCGHRYTDLRVQGGWTQGHQAARRKVRPTKTSQATPDKHLLFGPHGGLALVSKTDLRYWAEGEPLPCMRATPEGLGWVCGPILPSSPIWALFLLRIPVSTRKRAKLDKYLSFRGKVSPPGGCMDAGHAQGRCSPRDQQVPEVLAPGRGRGRYPCHLQSFCCTPSVRGLSPLSVDRSLHTALAQCAARIVRCPTVGPTIRPFPHLDRVWDLQCLKQPPVPAAASATLLPRTTSSSSPLRAPSRLQYSRSPK